MVENIIRQLKEWRSQEDQPWFGEPDRLEFRTLGFPCIIQRHPELGQLCGYLAVPPGHPWHGLNVDHVPVDVHGGVTYADKCQTHICHVPAPGESDDVWWIGFDCGHAWDIVPGMATSAMSSLPGCAYRGIGFVKEELMGIALQANDASQLDAD